MKNLFLFPTDKPSRVLYNSTLKSFCIQKEINGMFINDGKVSGADFWGLEKALNNGFKPHNIYIISDEEIKGGDWVYSLREGLEPILKQKVNTICVNNDEMMKKIILTTDQDLIKDGVQAIDDEFLEWFVKNPSCEEVKIDESTLLNTSRTFLGVEKYRIIIPKEEPKQDLPIVNGSYGCTIQTKKQEPKQETLEELKKWREEALIAHEINQKVIKKIMDEKKLMCSDEKIDKILQKLEEIKIMINIR